jgi:hypothetical protein
MTSFIATTTNWKSSEVLIIVLGFIGLSFGFFYQTSSISALAPQNTCIGVGGWPCGYGGPFTGNYYAGYATLGCVPITPNSTCVVPQIAMEANYLIINNSAYVIDWAGPFTSTNQIADGTTMSVAGKLAPIFYNLTAGSTYMIYSSNARGVWKPQPRLQIQKATLTTQPVNVTCTTTLSFTVSGPPNGVWNLPMIPAGDCYTVSYITQQQSDTVDNMSIPILLVLASSVSAIGAVLVGSLAFLRHRRKKKTLGAIGT